MPQPATPQTPKIKSNSRKAQPIPVKGKVVSIDFGTHRSKVLARRDALIAENCDCVPGHIGKKCIVRPIAERIMSNLPPSFELDDLMQTGHMALLHLATGYDPKNHNGTPFPLYAYPTIRGKILTSVRRNEYKEATHEPLHDNYEQESYDKPIEVLIDRKRIRNRIQRERLTNEQAAVLSAYYSEKEPSLATVAAQLGIPEWRAVRARSEALGILRRILKDAA